MDQIANMINTIKNGNRAGHESVVVPFSNIKFAIAQVLLKSGYIKNVEKKMRKGFPVLVIDLMYKDDSTPRVSGVERVSKSSCRIYVGAKEIRSVKNGHGMMVLTTPKGILTGGEAKKELVGGEVLFKIW